MEYMCLAVPNKIIKIEGEWATVRLAKHTHKANLSLIKNARKGDYVIIHGDLALNKMPKKDALKILNLLKVKSKT